MRHSGSSNFTVWSYNGNGDVTDLLVSTIGSYDGTPLVNLFVDGEIAFLEIGADGSWTVELRPSAMRALFRQAVPQPTPATTF